jgi:D-3-phosphoglycerate dehydrogenase / 2-oxoglutarate reductase
MARYVVVEPRILPRKQGEPLLMRMPEERPEWRPLREIGADLLLARCSNEAELIQSTQEADAVLAGHVPLRRQVIEQMRNCRVIARRGVGYENIDVQAATEQGILVTNVPDFCIEEVSNHTLMLLLACAKKLTILHNALRSGTWFTQDKLLPLPTIYNQTLGLIGFGSLGRAVARKAQALNMRIMAYDPHVSLEVAWQHGVYLLRCGLDRLLRESDYVSLHVPLNEETRHMLGECEFRLMKPTAYLINTARGEIVVESDLIEALRQSWIAGAALDVFEQEPPDPRNPLLRMENVIVTPHSAGDSDESVYYVCDRAGVEVARVLSGKWPLCPVNPEVRPWETLEGPRPGDPLIVQGIGSEEIGG